VIPPTLPPVTEITEVPPTFPPEKEPTKRTVAPTTPVVVTTVIPGVTTVGTTPSGVCKDKKERIDLDVSNLVPSSNTDTIDNIVFENGNPDNTWQPGDDDIDKYLQIDLPTSADGVPPGDYQIMEVKIKPTGNLGPVTVKIFDENWEPVFEELYNSTPMQIRPSVPGTYIVLYFSGPLTGIYDLEVFACVPPPTTVTGVPSRPSSRSTTRRPTASTTRKSTIATKPPTVTEGVPTVPLVTVTGIETKPVATQVTVKQTTAGTVKPTTPGVPTGGTVPTGVATEGTIKPTTPGVSFVGYFRSVVLVYV
jgi:hypothetical protein